MPTNAPNEYPAIHSPLEDGLTICIQSSAAAASLISPMPPSYRPWLRPTPRKLNRITEKPSFWND